MNKFGELTKLNVVKPVEIVSNISTLLLKHSRVREHLKYNEIKEVLSIKKRKGTEQYHTQNHLIS